MNFLRNRALPVALAIVSGILLALASNLHSVWWAAWIAPIPLLFAAYRWSGRAGWLGFLAGLIGMAGLFRYYAAIALLPVALIISVATALGWAFAVRLSVRAVRTQRPEIAVLVFPFVWPALETIVAAISPHGTAGSMAYSQMGFPPALQVASLGGAPAVTFVLGLFAGTIALVLAQGRRAFAAVLLPMVIVALALGWGTWRETHARSAPPVTVALIASDAVEGSPQNWADVWPHYAPALDQAARRGAKLAVLPEKIAHLGLADLARAAAQLGATAKVLKMDIVAGVLADDGTRQFNRAIFAETSGRTLFYDKQHLVPGFEDKITPGARTTLAQDRPYGRIGVAICKDMDFARLGRDNAGAQAMAVPGWDFRGNWGADGYAHGRLAILRGVENGYAVLRSGRVGQLVISDRTGRVLAEEPSSPQTTLLVGTVPIAASTPTLYSSIGELFGWLCVCVMLASVLFLRRPSPSR